MRVIRALLGRGVRITPSAGFRRRFKLYRATIGEGQAEGDFISRRARKPKQHQMMTARFERQLALGGQGETIDRLHAHIAIARCDMRVQFNAFEGLAAGCD